MKDGGKSHLVAEWGGTGFNFTLTPDKPQRYWFETYSKSAERFREIVTKAGADALISNHTSLDGSTTKLAALARRRRGDPHPYVIGNDGVKRYLTSPMSAREQASFASSSARRRIRPGQPAFSR